MNNFQGAEHADNGFSINLSESVSIAPSDEAVTPGVPQRQRTFSEEELGYRATCEESYDIMAKTIAIYANYPNALYAL